MLTGPKKTGNRCRISIFLAAALTITFFQVGFSRSQPDADLLYKRFLNRGNKLYKQKDFRNAVENLIFARELNEDLKKDYRITFKIAYAFYNTGEYKKADFYYSLILRNKLIADYALYHLALAKIADQQDIEANYLLEKLLKDHPESVLVPEAALLLAERLTNLGKTESSDYYLATAEEKILAEASLKTRYQARVGLISGRNQSLRGDTDMALNTLRNIVVMFPYTDEALLSSEEVQKIYEIKGQTLPDRDRLQRASAFIKQGLFSQALGTLSAPGFGKESADEIEYLTAEVYTWQEDFNAAIPRYSYLWKNSRHEKSLMKLGKVAKFNGQLDLSTRAYQEYLKNFPNNSWAVKIYAMWQVAANHELKGGTDNLHKAIKTYGDIIGTVRWGSKYKSGALFKQAYCYYKSEDYRTAIKLFQRTGSYYRRLTNQCDYWIAKSYEKMGQKAKARVIFQRLAGLRYQDYYGMLSYTLHLDKKHSTVDQLFYTGPMGAAGIGDKARLPFNEVLNTSHDLDDGGFFVEIDDETFENLEASFKKAYVASDILDASIAERELLPVHRDYLNSYYRANFLKGFYEQIGAYGKARNVGVFMAKRYRSSFSVSDRQKLLYPMYFSDLVGNYAQANQFDQEFLTSVIKQESTFQYHVMSPARAIGLMQIIPQTAQVLAKKLGHEGMFDLDRLFEPETSIRMGTYYLVEQAVEFDRFIPAMLSAYNAGPFRARVWLVNSSRDDPDEFVENIDIFETNDYVKKILLSRWVYSQLYDS